MNLKEQGFKVDPIPLKFRLNSIGFKWDFFCK
jgi:hypothetical protein